ncbi:prephenate dehydratase [Ancylomarina sp. 16SWW S1-10-2]|uniref:prephenate dehydratase n=1 Tax=Ancylomarina sp. 16SWW S1-10-2 TaxID=2499681 RepID=UPI0012AD5973|nr:prephenate dehydratase [Ancylomarina sp. 16SWW S1-10-2]MRT93312.1 prephenate dehydratase [Ancylomarina sp. 16SWW S1-10-2]
MQIAIQGVKGAFHEVAARNYFGDEIDILPKLHFSDLVESVKNGDCDYGIMAIENTISGTIHSNLNLIREHKLVVCGEEYLRIKQNLVAKKGTKIEDLNEVHSHYMAINQTRQFFKKYPNVNLVDSIDTALSMKEIAEKDLDNRGAIGSLLAAEHYGLEVLAESIETNKKNYTRFLILKKDNQWKKLPSNKASLAMVLDNHKGSLAEILSTIASHDINLSKIESVPLIGEPWHYQFYIDVLFDDKMKYKKMINEITRKLDRLDILGEYTNGNQSYSKIHHHDN